MKLKDNINNINNKNKNNNFTYQTITVNGSNTYSVD